MGTPRRPSRHPLLLALCLAFAGGAIGDEPAAVPTTAKPHPPLFPVAPTEPVPDARQAFDEVRKLILERYYTSTISEDALYLAAIRGMLRHVSPPQTPELAALWSPLEYERIQNALKGVNASLGISVQFNPADGSLTVTDIDTASAAGGILQAGDRIMRIDEKPLKGQSAAAIEELLNGKPGTRVRLKVIRDIKLFDIELVRQEYRTHQIHSGRIDNGTGYIRINAFALNISAALAEAIQQLQQQGVSSLIIDLRDNGGGVFTEGLKAAELFIPEKGIVLRTLTRPEQVQTYVSANKTPFEIETIILTNGNTASSSEIFAAALRAHGKARLVGTSSHGKATMEQTFELNNGYRTKFIVGALYDPRGHSWQSIGLQPDYYAETPQNALPALNKLTLQQRLPRDLPLATAWKLLQQKAE